MIEIIVQLLKYLGLALIVGGFFFCAVFAMSCCFISGRCSREEERAGAAPGGASSLHHHFQCPHASGSNRSVRASYQSVQSSGGGLD